MSNQDLSSTVARVLTLVSDYRRDAPFRAPETRPEWDARLLNELWSILQDGATSERDR